MRARARLRESERESEKVAGSSKEGSVLTVGHVLVPCKYGILLSRPLIQQLIVVDIHGHSREQLLHNGRSAALVDVALKGWVVYPRQHCIHDLKVLGLHIKALAHIAKISALYFYLLAHELVVDSLQGR